MPKAKTLCLLLILRTTNKIITIIVLNMCEPPFVRVIFIFYYFEYFFVNAYLHVFIYAKIKQKYSYLFICYVFSSFAFTRTLWSRLFFSFKIFFCTYSQLDLTAKFIRLIFSRSVHRSVSVLRFGIRAYSNWYVFEVNFMLPKRLVNTW